SGYDICRAIRNDSAYQQYSNTPVILLAGIYETMDEDRARQVEEKVKEVGANGLLSKPFDPQLLTTKVREMMEASSSQPAPADTASGNMFAEASPAEDMFASAAPAASPADTFRFDDAPVDDGEKTMMLPGPPSEGNNM